MSILNYNITNIIITKKSTKIYIDNFLLFSIVFRPTRLYIIIVFEFNKGKPAERRRRKATGPVKWQPVADDMRPEGPRYLPKGMVKLFIIVK